MLLPCKICIYYPIFVCWCWCGALASHQPPDDIMLNGSLPLVHHCRSPFMSVIQQIIFVRQSATDASASVHYFSFICYSCLPFALHLRHVPPANGPVLPTAHPALLVLPRPTSTLTLPCRIPAFLPLTHQPHSHSPVCLKNDCFHPADTLKI